MVSDSDFDPGLWIADPAHSHVGFAVRHMGMSTYRGRFEDFEATLRVDGASDPRLAGRGRLDLHGAREFRFESRGLRRTGEHLELDGVLSVGDRALLVAACGTFAAPRRDPWGGVRLGLHVQTRVDRRQFGLDFNEPLPGGGLLFDNEVVLEADLQLVRS